MRKPYLVIVGGLGKAGSAVLTSFLDDPSFEVVGVVDIKEIGKDVGEVLLGKKLGIKIYNTVQQVAKELKPDYFVDFTSANCAYQNALDYIEMEKSFVMCTSGLNVVQKESIERLCNERGISGAIIPNASTLAVLGMYFDKIAAKFAKNVTITEEHDKSKADAPSGTAYSTLVECAKEKGFHSFDECDFLLSGDNIKNSQFVKHIASGIEIHAHRPETNGITTQIVEFRANNQKLTIEHVAYKRESYKEGVALAINYLEEKGGFIQGLEKAMGLN